MKKEKKKCNYFVEKKQARCENYVFGGSSFCFPHYPKKEPIVLSLLLALLTFVLTILFNVPISNTLSKIPFLWYWVDNQEPIISEIIPNIEKSKELDKNAKLFKIICFDKGSGLNLPNCFINIYEKNDIKHKPIAGKLNKTKREVSLNLDKSLENGAYLLEISLIDKANNKIVKFLPFIVREDKDLVFSAWYKKYEESLEQKIFQPLIKSYNAVIFKNEDLYIYYLKFMNNDNKVILRNLNCTIDTRGRVIFGWNEIGSMGVKGAKQYVLPAIYYEKRFPESRVFMDQNILNIDEIGPEGFITFAILVGEDKLMSQYHPEGTDMRHCIILWGQYFSEGYGTSEVRKIEEDTLYLTKGN